MNTLLIHNNDITTSVVSRIPKKEARTMKKGRRICFLLIVSTLLASCENKPSNGSNNANTFDATQAVSEALKKTLIVALDTLHIEKLTNSEYTRLVTFHEDESKTSYKSEEYYRGLTSSLNFMVQNLSSLSNEDHNLLFDSSYKYFNDRVENGFIQLPNFEYRGNTKGCLDNGTSYLFYKFNSFIDNKSYCSESSRGTVALTNLLESIDVPTLLPTLTIDEVNQIVTFTKDKLSLIPEVDVYFDTNAKRITLHSKDKVFLI